MADKQTEGCPVFWLISVEAQAALMQSQWDQFGTKMNIPPRLPKPQIEFDPEAEELEKIDKIMRQPPKHQMRVT